jgi:hypothetical protein
MTKKLKPQIKIFILFLYITLTLLTNGCAKKRIPIPCPESEYESFTRTYQKQQTIDSLWGNGDFEIARAGSDFLGNFSTYYSKTSPKWGITLYGPFGMILSQIRIVSDSFTIFSPFLNDIAEGAIDDLSIEDYTGIPINPNSIPFITTGRILLDNYNELSFCKQVGDILEFSFDRDNHNITVGWNGSQKRIEYYECRSSGEQEKLRVEFRDHRDLKGYSIPYSIICEYKGMEPGYLELNYRYLEVK